MKLKRTISRVSFCEECAKRQSPRDGEMFAVYGGTHKKTWIYMYEQPPFYLRPPKGYVPHFFSIDKIENGVLHVLKSCGIKNCGTKFLYENKTVTGIEFLKVTQTTMSKETWIALMNFTDSGYKI